MKEADIPSVMSRRHILGGLVATSALGSCGTPPARFSNALQEEHMQASDWRRGFDGQRIADLGNGQFLNPIFSGDHPDPSIVRAGGTYYLTFSSFDAYPGIMIWESADLVNWQPVGPALHTPIGSVWAPDLVHHDGRFYIYIPARSDVRKSIYVIHSDRIDGPWSDPIDLNLPDHIDPAHIIGEDGNRYLFLSNGDMVPLTPDGLATAGEVRHVYDPWRYPDDLVVECFCPEGPKLLWKDGWLYMLTAVGGTAGPPTGHMVIAARSRSVHGPWEHAPHNPLIRTRARNEQWWSRGHASLVEGPSGDWWFICHGYEKDFWTLGRQCLLEPAEWSPDGWPIATGGDLSRPMKNPATARVGLHGWPLSDDFSDPLLHPKWQFYRPTPDEESRISLSAAGLRLRAKGARPADSSPLCVVAGDLSYDFDVEIEREEGASAGLLLFYNQRLYCGLGFDDSGLVMHRYGLERTVPQTGGPSSRLDIRIRNDRNIVTIYTRAPGTVWKKFDVQMEVSGYHHNTAYDFLSLRPALYCAGTGHATFKAFRYQGH